MPRNNYFQFKQFRIIQEKSAMKVGMDGVLIGAWTDVSNAERILDIGTGTGLIALMMAQKNSLAQIDAIEIDPEAFAEAVQNIQQSQWFERIHVELGLFQEFTQQTSRKYDLIVSNPPFFSNGIKAPLEIRAQARHSDSLPLEVLISGAANMLSEKGRIALVLAIECLPEIEELAVLNKLFISRLCRVKPNPLKPDFRILIELAWEECMIQEETLMIEFEKHHDYTPAYKELTREFYLKF
ncbi:MAG: methyltransferase [Bacteroidota bacterium]|nr:tRNA (adenosine(37)-N6)-methyltransferase TrmM [Odoribacter sp.]MDP3643408.1 methyltransferase [Bacteroidota bacterium]